jgi:phenylacetate-CoA ligase
MAEYDKSLIETGFGIPVISSYQATEALRIAYQCERREGFHINLDHMAVRLVDGNGNPVGPGERGEIVISNLVNRATVLLNYKLGDVVTLGEEACPCGSPLPTIKRLEGRSGNILRLPEGGLIHGSVLMEKLQMIPGIIQVQIVQEDISQFLVRAVKKPGAEWRTLCEQIGKVVHSVLGTDLTLQIMQVDLIPRESGGKVRPIISNCL